MPALHPFLLVAAFVLAKAIGDGVAPAGFVRPLLVGIATAVAVTILVAAICRSWGFGALATSAAFLLLLTHGPVIWLLRFVRDAFGSGVGTIILIALLSVATVGIPFSVVRFRQGLMRATDISRLTVGLNVFSAILLLIILIPAVPQLPSWLPIGRPQPVSASANVPNVYLIVLDGYARADELQSEFGFDNASFLSALRTRGFDVNEESHSNYTNTALTLPSLLGMRYLAAAQTASYSDADLRQILDHALREGDGLRLLRQAGYEVVGTSPGWEHVSLRAGVDRMMERPELTDLEEFLLWETWIPDLPGVPRNLFFQQLHSRVLGVLSDARAIASGSHDGPVFAFVHVPAPHLPIAFDAGGGVPHYSSRQYGAKRPAEYDLSTSAFDAAYSAAILALNSSLLAAVDDIMRDSGQPPVIVIMSDHGFDGASSSGGDPKLRNLLAAYTPGQRALLDSATPVNVLRILLNAYTRVDAGAELANRFFYTDIENHVTTVTEVTSPD